MKNYLLLGSVLLAFVTGCSDDDKSSKPQAEGRGFFDFFQDQQELPTLTIQGFDGEKISNAQVLIGTHVGSIPNNFLTADVDGKVVLPDTWTAAENLTIGAPGYVILTYMAATPQTQTIRLKKIPGPQVTELKGVTQGHQIVDRDGILDFGLVIPALTRDDLLSFNINSVISSEVDTIKIAGQEINIPTNISIPKQKEKYFITLTLEKPLYRINFPQRGQVKRVFAAKGRFPFEDVVDKMRKNVPFHDLINDFTITSGALRDVELKDASNNLNMPTQDFQFTQKKKYQGPSFAKDELLIAVGIANQNGYLIPTDLKRLTPKGTMSLGTIPNSNASVLTVLKKSNEMESTSAGADRISASLVTFDDGVAPTLLPLMPNPKVIHQRELSVPTVPSLAGVAPIGTYISISSVTEKTVGSVKTLTVTPHWEVYSSEWMTSVKLPAWPGYNLKGRKRWQVALMGGDSTAPATLGPQMTKDLTHLTNASVDYQ